jgi:uncharacterized membrane protein
MPRLFALCIVIAPTAVAAQDFVPRLYDVSGVAEGDVLNVRAGPSASAGIVATLAPDRKRVEVVGLDPASRWGRIGLPEGAGWVSLAYLERRYLGEAGMADGMRCVGTEPFWSLSFSGGEATWATPEGERSFPVASDRSVPSSEAHVYGWAASASEALSGAIVATACSDGMSDRPYGWATGIVRQTDAGVELFSGCCTLSAD